jgi:hypothetical protein
MADHEIPEASDFDGLSLLEHALHQVEDKFHEIGSLLLGHANFLINLIRNVGLPHPAPPTP